MLAPLMLARRLIRAGIFSTKRVIAPDSLAIRSSHEQKASTLDHAAMHGRRLFRTVGCTGCHDVDQGKPVPSFIVPMNTIFPGFKPVILAQRKPPLNPIQQTPGSTFELKMAVVNATIRAEIKTAPLCHCCWIWRASSIFCKTILFPA